MHQKNQTFESTVNEAKKSIPYMVVLCGIYMADWVKWGQHKSTKLVMETSQMERKVKKTKSRGRPTKKEACNGQGWESLSPMDYEPPTIPSPPWTSRRTYTSTALTVQSPLGGPTWSFLKTPGHSPYKSWVDMCHHSLSLESTQGERHRWGHPKLCT